MFKVMVELGADLNAPVEYPVEYKGGDLRNRIPEGATPLDLAGFYEEDILLALGAKRNFEKSWR